MILTINIALTLVGSTSQHYTQPLLENASQFMHFDSITPPKELADAVYVGKPTSQSSPATNPVLMLLHCT